MSDLEFNSDSIHPEYQAVERTIKEIEKQLKIVEIKKLYIQRDYLDQLNKYNKLLLKLRELQLGKGTTMTAEAARKHRIKVLEQKLIAMGVPSEPDMSGLEAERLVLDARLQAHMKINASLLASDAIRRERWN
ncbi:hypothetical protein QNI16_22120 [Cytophagaceae bacterium YF14B1]|uniref:Uncharacterized protein n=1 Tax=Xanthocytophaga flava TaxID=3048013 RepID=A0AAE3QQ28_9BACT|nr:hypothetical protein [Xanthocytophaga flavus]MDJ1483210.1 hypothetical protein [Xanthocytophaga flavus]